MTWNTTLTQLRDVLAELYPSETDSRTVILDAELDPQHIAFSSKAITNWQAILEEAHKQDKVEALAHVAVKQYPQHKSLQAAVQAYREWSAQNKKKAQVERPVSARMLERRKQQRRNALEQEYDLLNEKISRLRQALIIETDTAVKFKLEKQLDELKKALEAIETETTRLDRETPTEPAQRPGPGQMRTTQRQQMSAPQKMQLVDALLQCQAMSHRQTRETVVNDLPDEIKHNIQRSANDRVDVVNIVTTALNYQGGFESLIELVRLYEGNSIGMQAVDRMLTAIG